VPSSAWKQVRASSVTRAAGRGQRARAGIRSRSARIGSGSCSQCEARVGGYRPPRRLQRLVVRNQGEQLRCVVSGPVKRSGRGGAALRWRKRRTRHRFSHLMGTAALHPTRGVEYHTRAPAVGLSSHSSAGHAARGWAEPIMGSGMWHPWRGFWGGWKYRGARKPGEAGQRSESVLLGVTTRWRDRSPSRAPAGKSAAPAPGAGSPAGDRRDRRV